MKRKVMYLTKNPNSNCVFVIENCSSTAQNMSLFVILWSGSMWCASSCISVSEFTLP